ncbi:M15 family metallopeptidase [Serpentinicella sp. ANB-PHB4]|nr:M15 family metallopeptidase [Serpentinicella sp. ANB-PHB4]MDR5657919.1 M15 family metallopeptidase [Serpentinicella sp. ANB-PHB4]
MFDLGKENSVKVIAVSVIALSIWQALSMPSPFDSAINNGQENKNEISVFYQIYQGDTLIDSVETVEEALEFDRSYENISVKKSTTNEEVFNNYKQYTLYTDSGFINSFDEFEKAKTEAKNIDHSFVYDNTLNRLIYSNFDRKLEWTDDTKQGDVFLVNREYPLDEGYEPLDIINLTAVKNEYILIQTNNMIMDRNAFDAYYKMAKDAYDQGIRGMIMASTFRSFARQEHLFNQRVQRLKQTYDYETAFKKAATVNAIPGTSEHQTGLAVDITNLDENGRMLNLSQSFESTTVGSWLSKNSWKYGYILRYEEEKMDITGIIYEPWHFRYVGKPHAEIIFNNNLALEEYIDFLKDENEIKFTDYNNKTYAIYYFDSLKSDGLIRTLKTENISAISGDGHKGIILTVKK